MSNTSKTGREWLELMPEPQKGQILKNILKYDKKYENPVGWSLELHYTSFFTFINCFSWKDTPEGKDYWRNFQDNPPEHLRD